VDETVVNGWQLQLLVSQGSNAENVPILEDKRDENMARAVSKRSEI
jgi:hypothetical protein